MKRLMILVSFVFLFPFSLFAWSATDEARDTSNRLFSSLISAVTDVTTPQLLGPHPFDSEKDRVTDFLKKGPEFDQASKRIFGITQERFQAAGRLIRTVVHWAISRQGRR